MFVNRGKFGERNKSKTVVINNASDFWLILNNTDYIIKSMKIVSSEIMLIQYDDPYEPPLKTTSVAVAAFTTSNARVRLYEVLKKLDKSCLYFDTGECVGFFNFQLLKG